MTHNKNCAKFVSRNFRDAQPNAITCATVVLLRVGSAVECGCVVVTLSNDNVSGVARRAG